MHIEINPPPKPVKYADENFTFITNKSIKNAEKILNETIENLNPFTIHKLNVNAEKPNSMFSAHHWA